MKTRFSLLVLLGTLLASSALASSAPAASATASVPEKAFRANGIEPGNKIVIKRGQKESAVRRQLGEPASKLDNNTWLYKGCSAVDWKIDNSDCTMLVVTFTNNKVSDLKLVNEAAHQLLAAKLQKAAAPVAVAAK